MLPNWIFFTEMECTIANVDKLYCELFEGHKIRGSKCVQRKNKLIFFLVTRLKFWITIYSYNYESNFHEKAFLMQILLYHCNIIKLVTFFYNTTQKNIPPTVFSSTFAYFLQLALTKNPRKRPTADKLLLHSFVAPDLPRWLAVELLQKAHNPQHSFPPELEVCMHPIFLG